MDWPENDAILIKLFYKWNGPSGYLALNMYKELIGSCILFINEHARIPP